MPRGLVPEREAGEDQAKGPSQFSTPFPPSSAEEQLHAWINSRLGAEEQREKLWEPLLVSVALGIWGWYVLWFLRALHEYTIVLWP